MAASLALDAGRGQDVTGSQRIIQGIITTDDTTATIETGLSRITGGSVTPKATTGDAVQVAFNADGYGGRVQLTDVTSGDTYYTQIWGN